MLKFAICNETFQDRDWAATCRFVAAAGYQGIEIAPFTLAADVRSIGAQARREYRETALRAGLEVAGLHWLLVSPEGLSLTAPDTAIRLHTSQYLEALVNFCADMEGLVLVLGSPKQRRIASGDTAAVARERLMRALEPALARCEQHNITLCLEPLPAPEADMILTLQDAVSVIERLRHPNLRTILDVKSACSEAVSIPALIERHATHIAHVHANDANRRGPGSGDTDYVPIFSGLETIGYHGFVSVEVFDYSPDPETIACESLAYMQDCRQKALQALAADAFDQKTDEQAAERMR